VHDFAGQRVLLASSIRWPVAAKLALAFLRQGCEVQAICPQDHPFSFVGGISKFYRYSGTDSFRSLGDAITSSNPDLVIPCDDGVVWQLHALHRTRPELRVLIERSLGAPSSYEIVAGRAELMEIAKELQVRIPRTARVSDAADLREWFSADESTGVLKLDWTCGGKGVEVVRSLAEAEKALNTMRRPANFMTAFGRWLLIHDALAFWKWKQHRRQTLTLQQLVAGRPANAMMACRDGKVLGLVTVEVLFAQGPTGTALAVRLVENDEIRTGAERIAARLQLSGFHGLDYILEDGTGDAYLIELNPRCTQLGHLQACVDGDLAGILCRAFSDAAAQTSQTPIDGRVIAFFPEALMSDPPCPYLRDAYVDAPQEEPRLVRELMRGDWRDRRLLARLYRAVRPAKRVAVAFEDRRPRGSALEEPATAGTDL
jgi:hypothetical protein